MTDAQIPLPSTTEASGPEKLAGWVFVVTFLWIGFVVAFSFVEPMLRSRVPTMSTNLNIALDHVFRHGLTGFETFFAALLLIGLRVGGASMQIKLLFCGAALSLAFQTLLLNTRMDAFTLAAMDGDSSGIQGYEWAFVLMDFLKLGFLCAMAYRQVTGFALGSRLHEVETGA